MSCWHLRERWEGLRRGTLEEAEKRALLEHAASCETCRAFVTGREPGIAEATARAEDPAPDGSGSRFPLPLAAAIILLFVAALILALHGPTPTARVDFPQLATAPRPSIWTVESPEWLPQVEAMISGAPVPAYDEDLHFW